MTDVLPCAIYWQMQTFHVPFNHRLLFTKDVLSEEQETLRSLFEAGKDGAPRVQFWIDEGADASAGISGLVEKFIASCEPKFRNAGVFTIEGGEGVKNDWRHVERIHSEINGQNLDRRSYIVVIGGGAVLDAVGFAAATAHRGIRLVRLPTTTLGQDDSGVGVKNAVNRFGKKNWLGTFAVPWAVVNDEALLKSLPDNHYRAGFSEAVKVTLLKSRAEFEKLCKSAASIARRETAAASEAIRVSAELHRMHITQGGDPFEVLEARPLDFGHWSAHRLEAMTNFAFSHGEAVGVGVALDCVYSHFVHGFPEADLNRAIKVLQDLQLPRYHPKLSSTDELFAGLEEFRQHLGGQLTITMLRGVGDPFEVHEIDRPAMERAIEYLRQRFGSIEIEKGPMEVKKSEPVFSPTNFDCANSLSVR